MKHILSVTVNNSAGVLSHVSGLFTRRGYNIDSLSVGETEDSKLSIITLVVNEEEDRIKQIEKQFLKLIDVIEIQNLTGEQSLKRELLLANIKFEPERRQNLVTLIQAFQGTITDMTQETLMLELVASPRRINSFLSSLKEFDFVGMSRTGTVALKFPSYTEGKSS
jgi:acetolactate synthase I/III small subunit